KDHSQDELVDELEAICDVIHTDMKRTTKQNLNKTLQETFTDLNGKTVVASSDNRNVEFGLDTFYKNFESSGGYVHLWNETRKKKIAKLQNVLISGLFLVISPLPNLERLFYLITNIMAELLVFCHIVTSP